MDRLNNLVKVHSCNAKPATIPRDLVESGALYIGEIGVHISQQDYFAPLPRSCRCKKYVDSATATEYVGNGWAVWILQFKRRRGEVVINDEVDKKIMMPLQRNQVPRVDLVSRSDIERAYTGSEKQSKHFIFNSIVKKFEVVQTPPDGISKQEWLLEAEEEVKFERRIREQYKTYIEEVHKIYMEGRSKLIVPFSPDPFEGRCLFVFGDQRTAGGHQ